MTRSIRFWVQALAWYNGLCRLPTSLRASFAAMSAADPSRPASTCSANRRSCAGGDAAGAPIPRRAECRPSPSGPTLCPAARRRRSTSRRIEAEATAARAVSAGTVARDNGPRRNSRRPPLPATTTDPLRFTERSPGVRGPLGRWTLAEAGCRCEIGAMEPEAGPEFGGMTLNERLVAAGLLDALDEATASADRSEVIRILRAVAVPRPNEVADDILRRRRF